MPVVYQVILKDHSGERVALFDAWNSLRYHRERNFPDRYELILDLPDERTELFQVDSILEVLRRGDWEGAEWYLDLEALERRHDYPMDLKGQEVFTSWGLGYLELLTRRMGMYWYYNSVDVENGYLTVTGTPPEVIADFVNREAGPGAYYPEAAQDRRIPGLSLAAVTPVGEIITARLRNTQLLTRIRAIAEPYGLDIQIVGIGPGLFEFRVGDLLGEDKRWKNPVGNAPVVFSTGLGNMARPQYVVDRIGEITRIYVAGEGEGKSRVVYVLEDEVAAAASPWNLREGFVDARDLNTDEMLLMKAQEELAANSAILDLSFEVLETEACKYGRDWNLGDLVTATYRNVVQDYIVEAVDVHVANTGIETIEVDLVAIES